MSHVTYKIVQHDGGWAYTADGVFFGTLRDPCRSTCRRQARRRRAARARPNRGDRIRTADGKWHTETAAGSDRPETDVEDKA